MVRARGSVLISISMVCALLVGAAGARAGTAPVPPSGSSLAWSAPLSAQSIATEASLLSSRPVTVTCSTTATGWAASLDTVGLPSSQGAQYYGFSVIDRGEMYLSPYVCRGLQLGADPRTRAANLPAIAWSVDVLLHESVHLGQFTTDEALAEACARAALPAELHRLYGIPFHSAELGSLTLAATWFRRTQSPSYQGGSCSSRRS